MTGFIFIGDFTRATWQQERTNSESIAQKRDTNDADYKTLVTRIESKIRDQGITDHDVDYYLDRVADGSQSEHFCKNASKMNCAETGLLLYLGTHDISIRRQKGAGVRYYSSRSGKLDIIEKGTKTKRSKGSLDWDFTENDDLITAKYWRDNGGHQIHQQADVLARLLAAQEFCRQNPTSRRKFIAIIDCHDPNVIVELNTNIDSEFQDRVYCTDSDSFIESHNEEANVWSVLHTKRDMVDAGDPDLFGRY